MKTSPRLGAIALFLSTLPPSPRSRGATGVAGNPPAFVRQLPDYGRGRQLSRLCRSFLVTRLPRRSEAKAGHWSLATVCALLISAANLFAQGSLTPPGAPTPTMKTLDEVEPRTNLQATPAPPGVDTTNASYHFIITQPGSYYLSKNLAVTKPHGIQINAEGVTLDLNGFEISRTGGSGGNGIEIPSTSHRTSIRTGSLKGFAYGINSLFSANYPRGCAFRDLAASNCTNTGIGAGEGAVLESCRAHDNSGNYGILAEFGSSLSNCTASSNTTTYSIGAAGGSSLTNCSAYNNTGGYGILAASGSSLTNCSAYNNTGTDGISASAGSSLTNCSAYNNTGTYGIFASTGSSLTNCSAYGNTSAAMTSAGINVGSGSTVTNCTARVNTSTAATLTPTTGMGFLLSSGTIQNCTAATNTGDGIHVTSSCVVRENSCLGNGNGTGDGAGIHSTSSDNRIEGNNVASNDRGIDVDAAGSVIIRNTASGNPTNYDVAANNVFGAVVDRTVPASAAFAGNSAASSAGTTDPWANFSY